MARVMAAFAVTWRRTAGVLVLVGAVLGTGCGRDGDVSSRMPYSEAIGRTYRVVGDVSAYAVRADYGDRDPSYVTLRPVGLSGPEYASTVRLAKGTTFRILRAKRTFMVFDDGTNYLVEIDHPGIAKGLEVRVPLLDSKNASEGRLDPTMFEQVSR